LSAARKHRRGRIRSAVPAAPACDKENEVRRNFVFGPVPSRRLGISLGVDVIPPKTCTLDCIYCEAGRTRRTTIRRCAYVPAAEVVRQVGAALRKGGRVDWITFSGCGEPTLHSGLGEMIRAVKRMTRIPVAVLTSGTLLSDPHVRRALNDADLVVPNLDAGSPCVFRRINRPHPSLRLSRVAEGIARFRRRFSGRLWLEVVLLKGVNDSPRELARIAALAARIRPERIQLNTVVRPPAHPGAKPLDAGGLRAARLVLSKALGDIPVEIVAGFRGSGGARRRGGIGRAILEYLARRPATARNLAEGLGVRPGELAKPLARLAAAGAVEKTSFGGKKYYRAADAPDGHTRPRASRPTRMRPCPRAS
jgi:wyosine [tRNA(Phe)-imidazoG37] synthetase (radical SAM superfamily)